MKRHARWRCMERYGVELTEKDEREIRDQINRGTSKLVAKQSNRVTIYEVKLRGKTAYIAYDVTRKIIVSFLPPNDPTKETI